MMDFLFSISTQIHFGPGVSARTGEYALELLRHAPDRKHPVLVIMDPGVKELPGIKAIVSSLESAGLKINLFDQVQPNPKDRDVLSAALMIKAEECEAVIAIGGGSSIDTAKGAALIASHGRSITDYAGWGLVPGAILPVLAIPTTAGSGSEVTSWAVITDSASHAKLAIGDRFLSPAIAVVDPSLTVSLPTSLTAATGLDALTHAIEAYISALSNPINDLFALEAIHLVATNLLRVVTEPRDLAAREAMMLASTLGGIAINNADVAGVHCLTEGMGGLYDAPHGLLNAIFLPYFMAYWQDGCQERFTQIAAAFDAPPAPEEAVRQVVSLTQSLDLPSLVDIGVKVADLPRLAEMAAANVSNSSNPRPMLPKDYLSILHQAMAGSRSNS